MTSHSCLQGAAWNGQEGLVKAKGFVARQWDDRGGRLPHPLHPLLYTGAGTAAETHVAARLACRSGYLPAGGGLAGGLLGGNSGCQRVADQRGVGVVDCEAPGEPLKKAAAQAGARGGMGERPIILQQ